VGDARNDLPGGEVTDAFASQRGRDLFLALGKPALVRPHHVMLLSLELGRREAEPQDPIGLGDHRVEAAFAAVLLHRRAQ